MFIENVKIENFRSFENETVNFDRYSCMVGTNGAGKSSILTALNVFFREAHPSFDTNVLTEEDFYNRNTSDPAVITVTFSGLSEDAEKDLSTYVRHGKLVVTAKANFSPDTGQAKVEQFGQRLVMKEFAPFFELEKSGARVAELKDKYLEVTSDISDIAPPGTKAAMMDELRHYEDEHLELCELIESPDQFYGFTKGKNLLGAHIQWIYVPAVKDAGDESNDEKNSALSQLLLRTVRAKTNFDEKLPELKKVFAEEYQKLIEENQSVLSDISGRLQVRMGEWAHPGATLRLIWDQDPDKSVRIDIPLARVIAGEGVFEGNLARFGHGFQRSYLISLLQELAQLDQEDQPLLVLACEEPELYQHPPQARHLSEIFQKLSADGTQVLLTSHSPFFICGQHFENVRMVRKVGSPVRSKVTQVDVDKLKSDIETARGDSQALADGFTAKLHQALQVGLNEMFFCDKVVLCEGLEDFAFITTHLHLSEKWDEFRRRGISIVPANGKDKIIIPLAAANQLGMSVLTIFDADGNSTGDRRSMHERDNRAIIHLSGHNFDPFPDNTVYHPNLIVWPVNIGKSLQSSIGEVDWARIKSDVTAKYGDNRLHKNTLYVADLVSKAHAENLDLSPLDAVVEKILV